MEEEEEPRAPSPTILSPISILARRTLEIDPIPQEIYDYIEYLEKRAT